MKILIATGIYPPDIGGPATYSKALAEELIRRGHTVIVVTYYSGVLPHTPFRFVTVSKNIPRGVRHCIYAWKVLRLSRKVDSIFAQDPVSVGVPALCAARLTRRPFFLKVVGDYAWEQGVQRYGVQDLLDVFLKRRYGFRVELLRWVERYVARRARAVIVPSTYLKGVVSAWGVQENRIYVIPNSVSMIQMPSRSETRRALGYKDERLLLSIGRLVPWKGFSLLISLLTKIAGTLIIIGDGPLRQKLEKEAVQHGVRDRVVFTGALSKEKAYNYLSAADIFLLNTGYEGFSHQILEVMAAGLPVITTLEGGNREIIRSGENALVAGYNSEDEWIRAIEQLSRDSALSERISKNARKEAKKYTTEIMMDTTEKVILMQ